MPGSKTIDNSAIYIKKRKPQVKLRDECIGGGNEHWSITSIKKIDFWNSKNLSVTF